MNTATKNTGTQKVSRKETLKKLARKVTNQYIKFAHTKTLNELLTTFNYHYSANVERSREELVTLVKVQRNQVLWGNKIVA